ncbi:hypothetical protein RSAG8_11598, partial [Rhizoctonia solani AG-8 WAC10335]
MSLDGNDNLIYMKETYTLAPERNALPPVYDACTPHFVRQLRVQGLVASLSGGSRYLFQSGWWNINTFSDDFHFEAMNITGIVGMSLEKANAWRHRIDAALWLDTKKYTYALQEPHPLYHDIWETVVHGWSQPGTGLSATFVSVPPTFPQPVWFLNNCAWNHVQKHYVKASEDEYDEENSEK